MKNEVNRAQRAKKTCIFLTGATGTMGYAGMMEILRYPDQYEHSTDREYQPHSQYHWSIQ